jgi:hypothetical protein
MNAIKQTKIASFFIGALLILMVNGCKQSVEEAIIGRWIPEQEGSEVFMEFFEDGTLLMNNGHHGNQPGTWSRAGDNRIKTQISKGDDSEIVVLENVRIDGDRMTISFEGEDETLVRTE